MVQRILFTLALLLPATGLTGEPPARFSSDMMGHGVISHINPQRSRIIIDDRLYYVRETTRIEQPNGLTLSSAELAAGMRIGFDYEIREGRWEVMTHIRILANGADDRAGLRN